MPTKEKISTESPKLPSSKSPEDKLANIRALAMADKTFFANWPLNMPLAEHQARWLDLTEQYNYLLIMAPADHGKTHTLSIINSIFELTRDRNLRIGIFSAREVLAEASLRQIQQEFAENKELIRNFGIFKQDIPATWNAGEIIVERTKNIKEASISAMGVLSSSLGKRFDLIIADDIADYLVNSATDAQRAKLRTWFFEVLFPTLEPDGRMVVIATKQHPDDIYSDMVKSKQFHVVEESAIIDYDAHTVLWEEMWPYEKLMKRRALNPIAFEKRYQNRCVSTSDIFKSKDEIRQCLFNPLCSMHVGFQGIERAAYQLVCMGVDPDCSVTTNSKFTGLCVIGLGFDNKRTMLYLDRCRYTLPEMKDRIRILNYSFNPDVIMFEANAYQNGTVQEMSTEMPMIGTYTGFKKNDDMLGIPGLFANIKNGMVKIPTADSMSLAMANILVDEIYGYPDEEYSDLLMSWFIAEQAIQQMGKKATVLTQGRVSKYRTFRESRRLLRNASTQTAVQSSQ